MEFGRTGIEQGYFSSSRGYGEITGLASDIDGNIYTSDWGNGMIQKFKIPFIDNTPPSNIGDLHVVDRTSTSATLSWTATGDDFDSGSPAYYDIRYLLYDFIPALENAPSIIYYSTLLAGTKEFFEVKNLQPDTLYFFNLKAYDDAGNSSLYWGNFASIKTTDLVSPSPILNLKAVEGSLHGEINISWSATGDNGLGGSATSYVIRYSTISPLTVEDFLIFASTYPNTMVPKPSDSPETFTMTHLLAGVTCYIGIIAIDEENNKSPLSLIVNAPAGVDCIPPEPVIDLAGVSGSAIDEIDLAWTIPAGSGGSGISFFEVRYTASPIRTETDYLNAQVSSDKISLTSNNTALTTIRNLSIPNCYYFAVKAFDTAGNSSFISNVATVTLTFVKDITPPSMPVVRTASESDIYDKLGATWLTSDPESNIAENYYSLGTSTIPRPGTNGLMPAVASRISIHRGRSAVLGNRIYDITPHSETHPASSPGAGPWLSLSFMAVADIDPSSGKAGNYRKILAPQGLSFPGTEYDYIPETHSIDGCLGYVAEGFNLTASTDTLYVTGGQLFDYSSKDPCTSVKFVYYTKPNPDGSISQWFSGPQLPVKAWRHDSQVYDGRLYVFIGGIDFPYFGGSGVPYFRVFLSDINPATGELGQWRETSRIPTGSWIYPSVAVQDGRFFLLAENTLYSAKINKVTGELEPWEHQPTVFATFAYPMNFYAERSVLVSFNGRLFASGEDQQGHYLLYTAKPDLDAKVPESGPDAWVALGTAAAGGFLTENTRLYAGDSVSQFDLGGGSLFPFISAGNAQKVVHNSSYPKYSGQTLYFFVKSRNSQGLWSQVGISEGTLIKADEDPPKIIFTNPVKGGKIVGIPDAAGLAVNEKTDKIYVGGPKISVIDTISNTKINGINIDSKVLAVNSKLNHLYAIADYIPDGYSNPVTGLFVIDGSIHTILKKIPLSGYRLLAEPPALIVNEDFDLVYVTNENSVEIFNDRTMEFVRSLNISARDIYYSPYSKTLYAVDSFSRLYGFNAVDDYHIMFAYTIPGTPNLSGLVVDDENNRAYLAVKDSGNIIVLDMARKTVMKTMTAGTSGLGRSLLLNKKTKRIYAVSSDSGMYVFNGKDNFFIGRLGFGSAGTTVRSIAFNSANESFYAYNSSSGNITIFEDRDESFYKGIDSIPIGISVSDSNTPLNITSHLNKHDGLTISTITVTDKMTLSLEPGFYSLNVTAIDPLGNKNILVTGIFEVVQDLIPPLIHVETPIDAYNIGFIGQPSYAVYDNINDFMFVAKSGTPEIEVLDKKTGYGYYKKIPVKNITHKLILDETKRKVYALHPNGITVIDADKHEEIGYLNFGVNLYGFTSTSNMLFAGDIESWSLYILEKMEAAPFIQILDTISLTNLPLQDYNFVRPTDLIYDPSSDRLIIAGHYHPPICIVDYHSKQMTCANVAGVGHIALDPILNHLYRLSWSMFTGKKLVTLDASNLTVIRELNLSGAFSEKMSSEANLSVNPNNHKVYLYDPLYATEQVIIDGIENTVLVYLEYPYTAINIFVEHKENKIVSIYSQANQITVFPEIDLPVQLEKFSINTLDNSDFYPSITKQVLIDLDSNAEITISSGGVISEPSALDDGFYSLQVNAVDKTGNSALLKTGPFQITLAPTTFVPDILPPRTELIFEGPYVSSGIIFVSSETVFNYLVEDDLTEINDNSGTGAIVTRYSIDFGALGSGKFSVPEDGFHAVTYFSIDKAHNKEFPKTDLIFVDNIPPISFITYPYPGDILTGSSITITGMTYDFETGVKQVEVSTDNGKTFYYAVVIGTSSDGGVLWEYPFVLPKDYLPITLIARSVDMLDNVEETPDFVPVFIVNKLFPQIFVDAKPRVGQPGDKILVNVKVIDQFDRPLAGALVNISATTKILMPEGSTHAGFSPSVGQTDEYGIIESTFTIPGKTISQEEFNQYKKEYEKKAIYRLKTSCEPYNKVYGTWPHEYVARCYYYPPSTVFKSDSMEDVLKQIGQWLASSGLVSTQSEFDAVMQRLYKTAQDYLTSEMSELEKWLPRLAEMRRGIVTIFANVFGETEGFVVESSTGSINILSMPHAYSLTGLPTKDDDKSPNFMTLGNRSSAFKKEEVWGSVPGADELIAYSKARRQINYANPALHYQDFSLRKELRNFRRTLKKTWDSFRTNPLQFIMNTIIMSQPLAGAFLATSDWLFREISGTGLEGMDLPMSHKFTFNLKDLIAIGILPMSFTPPSILDLGFDFNINKGHMQVGGFAGFKLTESLNKNSLNLSYHSLGGFSLGGYSGALQFNAGQNDWYAGVNLLGMETFKRIGSSAMTYGLNAINITFAQGTWSGPVKFGIKDIHADWNAAKMMKAIDWGLQLPRFDFGAFGNIFNKVGEWARGVGEVFKGIGSVFADGSLDFNFPKINSPQWSGSGINLPSYSGGGDLLAQQDIPVCSIFPTPGPEDLEYPSIHTLPSTGFERTDTFSAFRKQDGEQRGLYADAGLTKNPVNTATGNLLYLVEDVVLPGQPLFIQMVRIYNSLAPKDGPFGYGWNFNYNMAVNEKSNGATVLLGDGGERFFARNPDGAFVSPPGTYSKLAKEPDGGYVLTHTYGAKHLFSTEGRLSSIIDRNGNQMFLGYSQKCLSFLTDSAGRSINLECDANNRITKITDFTGRILTYQYDAKGNLAKVTGSDGYNADYTYGSDHELLSYNDHASRTGFTSGRFEYDEFNRVTAEFDSAGSRIAAFSYEFSAEKMIATITDAEGGVTKDSYDTDGVWQSRKNPDGREIKLSFDSSMNLLKMDDGIAATEMTYDSMNRLQNVKAGLKTVISYAYDGDSYKIAEERLPDGSVIGYGYDGRGNIVSISEPGIDPNRGAVDIEYDSKGNPVKFIDPLGNYTVISYDAYGNKISVTDPAGGIRKYSYTPAGRLASTVDENGKTTKFSWTSTGYLETIRYPENETYSFTYDPSGRMLTETNEMGKTTVYSYNLRRDPVSVTDAEGHITELSYSLNGNLTKIKDPLGNVSLMEYDAAGRMTKHTDPEGGVFSVLYDGRGRESMITDAEGNTVSIDYNELDNPVRITDPLGGQNIITYDLNNRVSSITDPRGGATRYSYDARSLPVSITAPDGAVHSFEYDKAGNMMSLTDPDGTRLNYVYDSRGILKAVTDPADNNNPIIAFGLDPAGKVVSVKDAAGNTTAFELTWEGNPKIVTAPDGTYTAINYDHTGNPVSIRDPNGNTTTFEYDAFSNLTKRTEPDGSSVSYSYDSNGLPVKIIYPDGSFSAMEYDKASRLSKHIDPEGYSRSYRHDRNGNLILETDAAGNIWNYSYDENGRLKTVSAPDGSAISYEYDPNGNLSLIKDAKGNTLSFEYNAGNRLIQAVDSNLKTEIFERTPAGRISEFTDKAGRKHKFTYNRFGYLISYQDPLSRVTSYEYDKLQRPILVQQPSGLVVTYQYDPMGRILKYSYAGLSTSFVYDAFGNLKETVNPAGKKTSYSYDSLNRLTVVASPSGTEKYAYDQLSRVTSVTDTAGAVRRYYYDKNSRVVMEKDPLGNSSLFEYDGAGRKTAFIDAQSNKSVYYYDERGRLVRSVSPTGETSLFEYDANSNLTASVEPSGTKTEYSYDALNQLLQSKDPTSAITSYEYDAIGNQTSVTSPDGAVTRSYYDAGDQLIKTVDASGGITLYTYDANGNIKSITDPEGKVTIYTYDGAGRLTVIQNPDQSVTHYALDNEGKTTGVTDEIGRTLSYTYDAAGRITQTKDALNRTVSYTYDATGRRLTETDAAGHVTRYEYDAAGRLTAVIDSLNNRTSREYNPNGALKRTVDPLGRATVYEYDAAGRLIRIIDANSGVTSYTYDASGRKTLETYPDGRSMSFAYDQAGRLIAKTDSAGNITLFEYDQSGRLSSETDANGNRTLYAYDALGRLVTVTDAEGGVWNYSYTPAGLLASIKDAKNNTTAFSYDQRSRLSAVTDPLLNATRFDYDAAGRRTKMTKPTGEAIEYIYDAGDRLNYIKSGLTEWIFTWSSDDLLTNVSGASNFVYEYDAGHRLRKILYKDINKNLQFAYDAVGNKTKITRDDLNQI
ncbi:MAG: fibronectin type III domain-containing protein, partial [Elusimicrobia bacterium]|nr:fibronectin type III domain-containing protein [Elusimicrobiota bacterium]